MTDSEIEEFTQPYWHGFNVFESTLDGTLLREGTMFVSKPTHLDTTNNFSSEPAGVVYDTWNGHLFFSDDDIDVVFEVDMGPDGLFGTADDAMVRSFQTISCGDTDAEGITFNPNNGHLILAGGDSFRVFDIDPGPDGVFDGCSGGGCDDDSV